MILFSLYEECPLAVASTSRQPIATVVFRLLLAVSLWNGPVLWGHQHVHGATADAEHIARYHANDPDASHLGWHWHCTLPESSDTESEGQAHAPFTKVALVPGVTTATDMSASTPAWNAGGLTVSGVMPSHIAAAVASNSDFLASYLLTHTS